MAEKKKVLLRLDDVKMHFPIKKESLLQKEALSVRAVDGISVEIYEGETLGLVGESGCGKSTLGRAILQLYKPTHGKVFYYGMTLDEYAPKYVTKQIANIPALAGKDAATLLEKHLDDVRIAGGLLVSQDLSAVQGLLKEKLNAVAQMNKARVALELFTYKFEAQTEQKQEDMRTKLEGYKAACDDAQKKVNAQLAKIVAAKAELAEKEGYAQLEAAYDNGIDLARLTTEENRRMRRYLQIVFQDPYASLNPRLTVGNLISEALVAHGVFERGSKQLEDYTTKVMDDCGLQRYMLHRYPHQFSGGQRQRIGIARALALKPNFVVCDEAVSALDVSIQSQIINLLIDMKKENKLTYLFISHDLSTVKFISDRVGVMYLGNLIELGNSHDIYIDPLHPYTQALLEAIPTTEENSNKELQVLEGDIPSPIRPPQGCKFHTRCKYATDICKQEVPAWRELKPEHFVACHHPLLEKEQKETAQ